MMLVGWDTEAITRAKERDFHTFFARFSTGGEVLRHRKIGMWIGVIWCGGGAMCVKVCLLYVMEFSFAIWLDRIIVQHFIIIF